MAAPSDALEKMTAQIMQNVPKEESDEASQYPDDWDELAAQIAGMRRRGEGIDLPHEIV